MTTSIHQRTAMQQRRQHKARSQQKRLLIAFGIGAIAILGLMLMFSGGSSAVPDFSATTITGENVHLSDYHGQVVMLNFWATWCPPCRAEMPGIQAAYARYHDQGFNVLAINNGETLTQIQPFASALALQFPVLLDTDADLQQVFGIKGYPTSMFISPDGEIYRIHNGILSDQQLESYIATGLDMLKQKVEA
ncbi:MAG: TlpA disulfide reductase family protein [Anaerolineae bacterium]